MQPSADFHRAGRVPCWKLEWSYYKSSNHGVDCWGMWRRGRDHLRSPPSRDNPSIPTFARTIRMSKASPAAIAAKTRKDQTQDVSLGGNGNDREGAHQLQYAGKRGLNSEAQLSLIKRLCAALRASGESFFLSDQIERNLSAFLAEDESAPREARQGVKRVFRGCCEMLFDGETAYAVLRPGAGLKHAAPSSPTSGTSTAENAWKSRTPTSRATRRPASRAS